MLSVLVLLTLSAVPLLGATQTETAWSMLQAGITDKSADKREQAAAALGLMRQSSKAERLAEKTLSDTNFHVRAAAAKALGKIGAASARPKLREMLNDSDVEVVIAAANSLYLLKDPAAYEVYYAVLTGQRKSSEGLLKSELNTLKDRKSMEKMAFETGIGFVPFGGMGYEAWKTVTKDDTSPVRAAAAERLAKDPDPKSGQALAEACLDKKWRVRLASVDAIAERGDPALLDSLISVLSDNNDAVRYHAAAAILRLEDRQKVRRPARHPNTSSGR